MTSFTIIIFPLLLPSSLVGRRDREPCSCSHSRSPEDRGVHGSVHLACSVLELHELLSHLFRDADLRLLRRGTKVRGTEDLLVLDESRVLGWFFLVDVKGGAVAVTRLDRRQQCCLVNNASSRDVDHADSLLAGRQGLLVQHVPRLRKQGDVERDVVSLRPDLLQRQSLDSEGSCLFRSDDGIIADGPHTKGSHASRDFASNATQADDRQRLAKHLVPRE